MPRAKHAARLDEHKFACFGTSLTEFSDEQHYRNSLQFWPECALHTLVETPRAYEYVLLAPKKKPLLMSGREFVGDASYCD